MGCPLASFEGVVRSGVVEVAPPGCWVVGGGVGGAVGAIVAFRVFDVGMEVAPTVCWASCVAGTVTGGALVVLVSLLGLEVSLVLGMVARGTLGAEVLLVGGVQCLALSSIRMVENQLLCWSWPRLLQKKEEPQKESTRLCVISAPLVPRRCSLKSSDWEYLCVMMSLIMSSLWWTVSVEGSLCDG